MSEEVSVGVMHDSAVGKLSLAGLIETASGLISAGKVESARNLYKEWIRQNSAHPLLYVAHFNSSTLDTQVGDRAAAIESLRQAIALNADFMPAYINLGSMLDQSGLPAQALELWRTALNRPAPINGSAVSYAATALRQMARLLNDHCQIESAETTIQLCLDINPHQNDVIEHYIALRLAQCKWPIAVGRESIDRKSLIRGIHPLSMAVYTDDPLLQLASADRYAKQAAHEGEFRPEIDRRHAPIELKSRRLRIGYVSSDLRDHAIGYLMAEFFELHNKADIEVFVYYCGPASSSSLTTRIKFAVEHWTDIRGLDDNEAANIIAKNGIDILVDINGHTRDSRTGVFALRPAPVQVNWLGYPGSMGTPYHHYIIADDWIIPKASEHYYSEKVVRLPCYQANDRKRVVAEERPTRSDAGLPDDAIVFCCFNGTHKISPFTFDRWMRILAKVPKSVLWLLEASQQTQERLGDLAESRGIARQRLIFAPKQSNPQHLARYRLADIFLDTAPYGAHTTASDALWMGVPVLTLSGRSFASRVCGSLVRAAGLEGLVCTKPEDFVSRAISLGNNRVEIEAYKKKLEAGRATCRLFDMDLLVRKIEKLYHQMARTHNRGQTPRPNLLNLEAYMEAGIEFDHEAMEMLAYSDYSEFYRSKLRRRHLARPLEPDQRLWTRKELSEAEKELIAKAPKGKAQTANSQSRSRKTKPRGKR